MVSQGDLDVRSPSAPEPPSARWATVATDVLNVREAPSTDSAVLDSYAGGDSVQVIGEPEAGFVPVTYGDGQAWLAREYLSFDRPTDAMPVNPLPAQDVSAAGIPEVPAVLDSADPEAETVDVPTVVEVVAEPVEPVERWIDIDRSTAAVTLYDGAELIASFTGRIGRDPSPDGFYATAVGTFHVYSMNKGLAPTPFAEDAWLTDWVGFDPERNNGIHSPVRDADGVEKPWQNPATLGCVRLNADAAVAVFDFAELGMRVEVHD